MNDNLDKAISEMKKQERPIARVFLDILEDARQMCSPGMNNPIAREKKIQQTQEEIQQRSETMETYSTLEAMTKAKARPGTRIILGKRDVITYEEETETTVGKWEIVYCEGLNHLEQRFTLHDKDAWKEEQPEIQPGDWVRFNEEQTRLHDSYALVTLGDEKNGIIANHLNSSQAFLGNCGTFFKKHVEKVTDERSLLFLNGGRKPDDWKDGDIATDGVSLFTIGYDWHEDSAREQKFMPVCFAESRVDRGDTP